MYRVPLMLLCLVLVGSVLAPARGLAQEASPVAAPGAWVGEEPDLAAMPVIPADLERIGRPGMGRFFNGAYFTPALFVEGQAGFYGKPVEESQRVFDELGLRRVYLSGMGMPSIPGEDSPPTGGAYANFFAVEIESDAFLDHILTAEATDESTITVTEAPFDLGGRAVVNIYTATNPENGDIYYEYSVVFRVDTVYVDVGLWTQVLVGDATPTAVEATPVAAAAVVDPTVASPAGTIAELEALARRQQEKVRDVLANGAPNLSARLLRLGDDPIDATADYTEGYRLLNGEMPPYYAGFEDDILADPAASEGADAVLELEERFQRGDEQSDQDYYYLARLYQFPDEAAAATYMAGRPDVLARGGFLLATGATDDAQNDLRPGEATDLGDESLAFDFVRAFDDGWRVEGYEIYVRVGSIVAAVSLEGPADMPLDLLIPIAAAQAACLEAGSCPDAIPVPAELSAPLEGTPEAATPAS